MFDDELDAMVEEILAEDAPVNATGAAVSTDANSIGFKKRNKKYEPHALFSLLKRNAKR